MWPKKPKWKKLRCPSKSSKEECTKLIRGLLENHDIDADKFYIGFPEEENQEDTSSDSSSDEDVDENNSHARISVREQDEQSEELDYEEEDIEEAEEVQVEEEKYEEEGDVQVDEEKEGEEEDEEDRGVDDVGDDEERRSRIIDLAKEYSQHSDGRKSDGKRKSKVAKQVAKSTKRRKGKGNE